MNIIVRIWRSLAILVSLLNYGINFRLQQGGDDIFGGFLVASLIMALPVADFILYFSIVRKLKLLKFILALLAFLPVTLIFVLQAGFTSGVYCSYCEPHTIQEYIENAIFPFLSATFAITPLGLLVSYFLWTRSQNHNSTQQERTEAYWKNYPKLWLWTATIPILLPIVMIVFTELWYFLVGLF